MLNKFNKLAKTLVNETNKKLFVVSFTLILTMVYQTAYASDQDYLAPLVSGVKAMFSSVEILLYVAEGIIGAIYYNKTRDLMQLGRFAILCLFLNFVASTIGWI